MIRILHVDDNSSDQELTALFLREQSGGLKIDWATSGKQALEMLAANEYDCILSDYQMPGMNGMELLRTLRKNGDDTPFIFLTGQGNETTAAEALRAGAEDYYTKKVGFAYYNRLINSIQRIVKAEAVNDERRKSVEHIRRLNLVLKAISNVDLLLTREIDLDKIISGACKSLTSDEAYRFAWIALLDKTGNISNTACAGSSNRVAGMEQYFRSGKLSESVQKALHQPNVVSIEHARTAFEECLPPGPDSEQGSMTVRLEHGESIYGVLTVSIPLEKVADAEVLSLITRIAGNIAFAIHKEEINEKRILAEKRLELERNRLLSIFQNMKEGVCIIDQENNIEYVNPFLRNEFGSVENKKCFEFLHQRNSACPDCKSHYVWTGESDNAEWCSSKTGHTYNISYTAIKNADGTNSVFGIFHDITEQVRTEDELNQSLEQLALANKNLESFTYTVSHDLSAPLRRIRDSSSILLDDHTENLDAEGKDLLSYIDESTKRMDDLIKSLLLFSRASTEDINRTEVDLSLMAEEVNHWLKRSERERRVKVNIAGGMTVECDEKLFKVALENLFANAWKFTEKTSRARIEFGVKKRKGTSEYFVKDNGVGFDMKSADKLFQPFERLHSEEDFKGTGIGLATVKRIIQRHGGVVWAEGEVGKGATFYFTLN